MPGEKSTILIVVRDLCQCAVDDENTPVVEFGYPFGTDRPGEKLQSWQPQIRLKNM